ncbi:MAG: NAD(+)/NADH kinase [Planctomycetes bacterium]|nr:NAD(+)/NADH kinase [Planctomycetota bacterium]
MSPARSLRREDLRRVLVYGTPFKPAGQEVARSIAQWLERAGLETLTFVDGQEDIADAARAADLAISVGGDGTMLSAARAMRDAQVPTLGINLGKLGFLAEFTEVEVRDWVEGRQALDLRIQPRMRLRCVVRTGDRTATEYALNDAAVQQGLPTRLLTLDMDVDGQHATQYRADGIVISTPVGSTAYSLSLGGPILTPGLQAFIVTPIAPHALTNRPVVVGGDHGLRFTLRTQVTEAAVVLDGHVLLPLVAGSVFEVGRAAQDFLLVTPAARSYYFLLRQKLGWGEVPRWRE